MDNITIKEKLAKIDNQEETTKQKIVGFVVSSLILGALLIKFFMEI